MQKNIIAESLSPLQWTPRSEETFYAVVDSPEFFKRDAQMIYRELQERLKPISFGNYLKRYIYRKAEIIQPFETMSLGEYQDIIAESFANRGVPASFSPTTAKIRSVAKNWLTQNTVSRDAVLLMGFGLYMCLEDVEELLTKGLQETRLDLRNIREILCGYCYAHGYGYHKYENLAELCGEFSDRRQETALSPDSEKEKEERFTIRSLSELKDEQTLLRYVRQVLRDQRDDPPEQEAKRQFMALYRRAQEVTAAILTALEQDTARLQTRAMEEKWTKTDQFYDYQKQEWIHQRRKGILARKPEEITPTDIEHVLQAAIPRDRHGNLLPMKKSTLYRQFRGKRLSRQRLEELLTDGAPVTRYDLIMLQFFIYSQRENAEEPRLQSYRRFLEETNELLEKCGMGPLYMPNPFECFLLMCILSEDPMGTYADVMEQSYTEAMS